MNTTLDFYTAFLLEGGNESDGWLFTAFSLGWDGMGGLG